MRKGWMIPAGVFVLDRAAKLASRALPESGTVLIPGVVRLIRTENQGMAFSLLSGHGRLLGIISLIAVTAGFLILRKKPIRGLGLIGLLLMAGGALGNMPDRLITGSVTDMIEPLFVRFAVFNPADAALTVGCVLTAVSLLFRSRDWGGSEHGKHE